MKLPKLKYIGGRGYVRCNSFGGVCRKVSTPENRLFDCENVSSDAYPLITTRKPRYKAVSVSDCEGMCAGKNGIAYVSDGHFVYGGQTKGTVTSGAKQLVPMNEYIAVFPDGLCYDPVLDQLTPIGFNYTLPGICNGQTYRSIRFFQASYLPDCDYMSACGYDVTDAQAPSFVNLFHAGQRVHFSLVSGSDSYVFSAKVHEIRGSYILLDEIDGNSAVNHLCTGTITADMPTLDYVCECNNRLWGCHGSTICASALGNPYAWYDFDGISTDSYTVDVGSSGAFTACCAYASHPRFFKSGVMYTVFGSEPSEYTYTASGTLGVASGSSLSAVEVGGRLMYLSDSGVCSYGGSFPDIVSYDLGVKLSDGIAATDGTKYYLSAYGDGVRRLYVYDTERGTWHIEKDPDTLYFARYDKYLYCATSDGIYVINASSAENGWTAETGFTAFVRLGSTEFTALDMRSVTNILIRMKLIHGTTVRLSVSYDGGDFECVHILDFAPGGDIDIPLIPRRCENFCIRIDADGAFTLNSITKVYR